MSVRTAAVILSVGLLTVASCSSEDSAEPEISAASEVTQESGAPASDVVKLGLAGSPADDIAPAAEPAVTTPAPAPTTEEAEPVAPVEEPTRPEPSPAPSYSVSQESAIRSAESYLSFTPFSRLGLIDQLEYEGYSTAEAEFAVDSLSVNWDEQAVGSAQSYISFMSFSRQGLIDQLIYEGFSESQAIYGVDSLIVDWNEQAAKSAQSYLDLMGFSRQGLIDQLMYEGFSLSEATYGVDQVGL